MECKVCGKEIADGKEYCEDCEQLIPDSEVIHVTRDDLKRIKKKEPRLKADGPFIDIEGYARSLITDYANILALVGAVLMYLSPYCCWLKITAGKTIKGSLFDIAGKYIDDIIALKQPELAVSCILLILSGIMMLILSARENIRLLRPYADNYIIRFIPVVLSIIAGGIVMLNSEYRNVLKYSSVESGVGKTMCILGIILYVLSIVMSKATEESA